MKARYLFLLLILAPFGFWTCFSLAIDTESEVMLYLSVSLFLAPFWCAMALLLEAKSQRGGYRDAKLDKRTN